MWYCSLCKKPTVKRNKEYLAIGCKHYAVVKWTSGEAMLIGVSDNLTNKINSCDVLIEAIS